MWTFPRQHFDDMVINDHEEMLATTIEFLRDNDCPCSKSFPEPVLRDMVELAINRARQRGLRALNSILAFVACMFEFAPNFDQHPHFKTLIAPRPGTNPDQEFRRAADSAPERVWQDVLNNYDRDAWSTPPAAAPSNGQGGAV